MTMLYSLCLSLVVRDTGHRIRNLLQCKMSAFGTKRTNGAVCHLSAFGGKADKPQRRRERPPRPAAGGSFAVHHLSLQARTREVAYCNARSIISSAGDHQRQRHVEAERLGGFEVDASATERSEGLGS